MPAESPVRETRATSVAKTPPQADVEPAEPRAEAPKQDDSLELNEPETEPPGTEKTDPTEAAGVVPSACATTGDVCLPPAEFAGRLCSGKNPDVAVYMMQKGQPWTRGYVRIENVDTLNTLGGPTGEAKLVFGEEVVILRGRLEGPEGVQVSGTGGFIVLRWDGTCATLAEHELVTWVPGLPRHAPLVWKYLGDGVQSALLESRPVRAARKAHREQCRGAGLGRSPECLKATERLNEAIVVAVRTGTKVPFPERVR